MGKRVKRSDKRLSQRIANDIQPWLDVFDMLLSLIRNGFLEMDADKGEAWITEAAIHVVCNTDDLVQKLTETEVEQSDEEANFVEQEMQRRFQKFTSILNVYNTFLRVNKEAYELYAKNTDSQVREKNPVPDQGSEEVKRARKMVREAMRTKNVFALHVVGDDAPHHLHFSIVLSSCKHWWNISSQSNHFEFITYR